MYIIILYKFYINNLFNYKFIHIIKIVEEVKSLWSIYFGLHMRRKNKNKKLLYRNI